MDDLDDLFGAFDGKEVENDVDSDNAASKATPKTEKKDTQNTQKSKEDADIEGDEEDTGGESMDVEKNNSVKSSVYSTVMSQQKSEGVDPIETKQEEIERKEKEEKEEKERIIATGTSHDKSVRSYSAYPKSMSSEMITQFKNQVQEPLSDPPAKTYEFKLDPFQEQAVNYIDKDQSVLVAAHTSAGKTAVAEYAIAKSLKNGQRVVYTSPIKALSNQKFRDLQEEFSDVGLMTGDITINNEATVLVMTTEILRSMLYRGSELMREVAWVIYDEVHYMRDTERGVVWEESIILLPDAVKFVFLSATIPNAEQFADWIAQIHHQPCHVVYTNYRPVPLQHYIFPQNGEGLHLVVDERGKFREQNFQRAMATLQSSNNVEGAAANSILSSGGTGGKGDSNSNAVTGAGGRKRKRTGGPGGGRGSGGAAGGQFADLSRIVKLIMDRNLNPVIIFSFSKKDCEKFALALNKQDFTDDIEKDLISQVYTNAIDSLGEDDRKLPQVQALLPLLKRGIGIHHGGLLPILKEIVEILFSEGLIKTLFATETFSIGINMPAKTVVFTNTRKWDGKDFRWVTSGEYIQMSGRAGRRGKDDRGIVIQMLDEKMEPDVCKNILYGESDPLNSSYRISYNMLLNLMRVEDVDPEYLLRASFHQFQRETDAPALIEQADDLVKESEIVYQPKSEEENTLVAEYYQMNQQLILTKTKINSIIRKPEYILKYLQKPGRLLSIEIENESYGWGVLVSCKKGKQKPQNQKNRLITNIDDDEITFSLDVLLMCVDRSNDDGKNGKDLANSSWTGSHETCRPVMKKSNTSDEIHENDKARASMRVFTVGLENIEFISPVILFLPKDISSPESRKQAALSMEQVKVRSSSASDKNDDSTSACSIPLLDPVVDMGITEASLKTLLNRAKALNERLAEHKLSDVEYYKDNERTKLLKLYGKKMNLLEEAKALKEKARSCQTMSMKDDLKKMKRVLKKLGHVDVNGVIQTKGRTACEINTADELLVVELIFTGVFNDLSCEQCVSLLSCMTYDERMKDDDDTTKSLRGFFLNPFHKLREVARTVVQTQIACDIEQIDEEEFVQKFNPGMMEAVFAWCKGAKFVEVQKLTGTYEGTTIRTLRRLEELIRQIAAACKAIGNQELQMKFERASELIKRDIVFCNSLYL